MQLVYYYQVLKINEPWKDMEEPFNAYYKWKKPIWKGYILYDSNYIYDILEKTKTRGAMERSVVARGRGRDN